MFIKLIYTLYFISTLIYIKCFFKKTFDINLKYFSAYLFFMLLFEGIAYYFNHVLKFSSLPVYNILTFFEFNCLLFFIREILPFKVTKKIVIGIILVFNIIYFSSNLYAIYQGDYLLKYNDLASITGSFSVTIAIFLFFKDFINSDSILNFKKSLSFWITVGLLIYYLGTIPITTLMNSMQSITKSEVHLLFNVQYILVTIMYCIFIFGALWSQKKE